MRLTAHCFYWI